MTKEELKEYLCRQIDRMEAEEIEEFSSYLQSETQEEEIARELTLIRGEFKKLTRYVSDLAEKTELHTGIVEKERVAPLLDFDRLLKNSVDAVLSLPKPSVWNVGRLHKSIDALKQGCRDIEADYEKVLNIAGIRRNAKRGENFDPSLHEAVEIEEDRSLPDGTIVEVLEEGYLYGDEVLNFAKVKVNKWTS